MWSHLHDFYLSQHLNPKDRFSRVAAHVHEHVCFRVFNKSIIYTVITLPIFIIFKTHKSFGALGTTHLPFFVITFINGDTNTCTKREFNIILHGLAYCTLRLHCLCPSDELSDKLEMDAGLPMSSCVLAFSRYLIAYFLLCPQLRRS